MEQADTIIQIPHFYGSLKGMQDKFDKYARQDAFTGSTREEWEAWKETSRETLKDLLGWKYMETCDLAPRVEEVVEPGERHSSGKSDPSGRAGSVYAYVYTDPAEAERREAEMFSCPSGASGSR